MLKAVIIDNENNIIKGLQKLLSSYCPDVQVVDTAHSVESGVKLLSEVDIDLLFLDIELDDGTGFDILQKLDKKDFGVIFITAYDTYAVDAFKMSAIDYLLKPLDSDDLTEAVNKAKDHQNQASEDLRYEALMGNLKKEGNNNKRLVISDSTSVYALNLSDILFLEAQGAYTKFVLRDKEILASNNLKSYEELLKGKHFIRTHHSFLVNVFEIDEFNRSDAQVVLSNQKRISVSVRKKEQVVKAIKELSI